MLKELTPFPFSREESELNAQNTSIFLCSCDGVCACVSDIVIHLLIDWARHHSSHLGMRGNRAD